VVPGCRVFLRQLHDPLARTMSNSVTSKMTRQSRRVSQFQRGETGRRVLPAGRADRITPDSIPLENKRLCPGSSSSRAQTARLEEGTDQGHGHPQVNGGFWRLSVHRSDVWDMLPVDAPTWPASSRRGQELLSALLDGSEETFRRRPSLSAVGCRAVRHPPRVQPAPRACPVGLDRVLETFL
jgi:hypothetical protein